MALDIRTIDDRVSVAPQIAPADVAAIRDAGFVTIVNNRPDGEAPDQPAGDEVRAAAEAAGLAYHAVPVGHAGIGRDEVDAMAAAIAGSDGPVLAYCRSGTRSCNLWALSQAAEADGDVLVAKGAGAGYDLSGLMPTLASLRGAR